MGTKVYEQKVHNNAQQNVDSEEDNDIRHTDDKADKVSVTKQLGFVFPGGGTSACSSVV